MGEFAQYPDGIFHLWAWRCMAATRLIIIEDEARTRDAMVDLLAHRGYLIAGQAHNLSQAVRLVMAVPFDCAVVDMKLHGKDVATVVERLRSDNKAFVLTSGTLRSEIKTDWLRDLPHLVKPFGGDELIQAIENALAKMRQI